MSHKKLKSNQSGFTIIELLIASVILSVMLVMVTVIMIGIGNLFYKGVSQVKVQTAVRNITESVSHDLEYTDGSDGVVQNPALLVTAQGNIETYCIGKTRYTFMRNHIVGTNPVHALWRDTLPDANCPAPHATDLDAAGATGGTNGTEMLPPNSRITEFNIGSAVSPYPLKVSIAYGDDTLTRGEGMNTTCKSGKGDHFCATAKLQTQVLQRINSQ